MPLACSVLGHAYGFAADGPTLRWDCRRCGAVGGTKSYASPAAAARYAAAFDARTDRAGAGSGSGARMTPLSLIPLQVWRRWRRRGSSR